MKLLIKGIAALLITACFLLASCSLSAEQEKTLNNAMTKYIRDHNEERLMSYIGSTHPNAVAYYLDKGDSAFKEHFTIVNDEGIAPFLQDGNIREIESDGNTIHVRYEFIKIIDEFFEVKGDKVYIYAVSEDDGKSWYFIDETDYLNDKIIAPADRLIDSNE